LAMAAHDGVNIADSRSDCKALLTTMQSYATFDCAVASGPED